ncbi:hypothetical protein CL656_00090 [bacterium]|nr:hypothetical protein [bacterium]|tara:strand:+ start:2870 stop:3220 length:351 start_codon:yes stop_codon:yes gene_type:complete
MEKNISEKDFLMYFHTSIRNLGLFITVSLAILTVSRAYRGKNKLYNIAFIFITLLFLLIALYKNYYLILTLKQMKNEINENNYYTNEIIFVPKIIMMLILIIMVFCLFTFQREFLK